MLSALAFLRNNTQVLFQDLDNSPGDVELALVYIAAICNAYETASVV
jgi:mannitol/fructose-specific phosphotransferase system IIA component (Ntr-type)